MELIIIIAIIAYVIKASKASNEELSKRQNTQQPTYEMPKQATRTTSPRAQVQQQNADWQKAAQENIARARQRAAQKLKEFENDVVMELNKTLVEEEPKVQVQPKPQPKPQSKSSAMQQVHEGRVVAQTSTINDRARVHTDAKKADVTLETMEAEHNHSERVSAAVHHHTDDILPESMLGSVEDLMVKGFDGNLCFERDFVGEGLDMISRFSYQ